MEWLTTGQMIDRLKVGEVAESESEFTRVFYDIPSRTLVYTIKGNMTKKNQVFDICMDSHAERWRILPKYVTFEEAMKAMVKGKKVKRKNDDAWYTSFSLLEYTLDYFYKNYVKCDEWIIKEDN